VEAQNGARIWIRIKKEKGWIRIRIEAKSLIRILIQVMRISNPDTALVSIPVRVSEEQIDR
jgi:hypothetical protein